MAENGKLTKGNAFPEKLRFESFVYFCSSSTNDSELMAEYKLKIKTSDSEVNFEQNYRFTFFYNFFFCWYETRF